MFDPYSGIREGQRVDYVLFLEDLHEVSMRRSGHGSGLPPVSISMLDGREAVYLPFYYVILRKQLRIRAVSHPVPCSY